MEQETSRLTLLQQVGVDNPASTDEGHGNNDLLPGGQGGGAQVFQRGS